MITATITLTGDQRTLQWAHGVLSGDEIAIVSIRQLAAHLEGRELRVAGLDGTHTNHLASARGFIALCVRLSDVYPTIAVEGDEPELRPSNLPEGTIS